ATSEARRRIRRCGDGDREGVGRAQIDAAIGDAAVVMQTYGDRRRTTATGRWRGSQRADCRYCGLSGEQRVVLVRHLELAHLFDLLRGTGADRRGPVQPGLRTAGRGNCLIGAADERWRVVHSRDGDGERLDRARVDAAVGRATVVVNAYRCR